MRTAHLLRGAIVSVAVVSSMFLAAPPVAAQNEAARAFRLDNTGHQDEAIVLYRQVLARDPRSYDAHYGIARALDLTGNYTEAREHFAKAIELAPDDGSRDQALRMMGVSWTFVGDARQAIPFFTRVFDRRVKAGDWSGAAEEANEIGRVLLELGDVNGAQQWYRTGFDTSRRDPKLSASGQDLVALRWAHAQARIAIRRGNRAEAGTQTAVVKSLLDKRTNPDQRIQYSYLTGYVAFYEKDYKRAVAELQQADQEDPFILLLTAQAHERLGDASRAREYYGKVLSSNSHAITNAFARPVARRKLPSPSGNANR
jgi:tetratricopeptide (TPR) repeat protein